MSKVKLNFRKMPNFRLTKDLVMNYYHLHKRFLWFYIACVSPQYNHHGIFRNLNSSKLLIDIKNKIVNGRYKFYYIEDMHYYSITHIPMLYDDCEITYFNNLEEFTNKYIQDFI